MSEKNGKQKYASESAAHVLAGFRYQLLQSVAALIELQEGQSLWLEVSEDFSIVSDKASIDVQVKNSQAAAGPPSYSLQSQAVRGVLGRFWQAEEAGERALVFLARGGAMTEREHAFPEGVPGLVYWRAAAIDGDTEPLRTALAAIFKDEPLGNWLASSPSDDHLRTRLLRRVRWELDALPAEGILSQTRDQVEALLLSKNLPVSVASQAVNSLLTLALETASKPLPQERKLDLLDVHRVLEEAAGVVLVTQQMAAIASNVASAASEDVLVTEMAELPATLARRSTTIAGLIEQTRGQPLLWIHGAHGVGKSTLARLLAESMGGRWLVVDLWPVQDDRISSLAAWRELARSIAAGPLPDGIIVDDFASEGATALRPRLAALARTMSARGARVIVTSHQAPSPAHLSQFGATAQAMIHAPYLGQEDLSDLVRASPAPEERLVQAWTMSVAVTTGGGHPLLAAAKIASLRARGWPNVALVEDFLGTPSQAVTLTRDEARRKLLGELADLDAARSLDAGQLLRRIGCLFDRADDDLARKLSIAEPRLPNGGDALAVLRGSWLELLPSGGLRISPLIADIVSDVPPDEQKRWRQVAAEHWLGTRVLNERTLPLCFWNALLGEHDWVLIQLCILLQSIPTERVRGAAALLSPITAFKTDTSLYPGSTLVAGYLRLLQFEVADAVEQAEVAGRAAERLLVEIDDLPEELGALLTVVAGIKILAAEFAAIPPAVRLDYALRVRAAYRRAEELSNGEIAEPRQLLPPQFHPGMDLADFVFAAIVPRIRDAADELDAFKALDSLPKPVRDRLLDAMGIVFSGLSVFVHSGWSKDQLGNRDMASALRSYDEVEAIAAGWERPDMMAEIACARSVILDEGLERRDDAFAVIDAAMEQLGSVPPLLRQKSKLLGHANRHREAAELLVSIEDQVGLDSPFDRALGLREGGLSAARAGQFTDAIRMFEKAFAAIADIPENAPFAAGILVEKSLALWRSGDKASAVAVAADALDAVEAFPPDQSRQAERSHQFARAITGLFFSEFEPQGDGEKPPFDFGQPSALETGDAKLLGVELKPLADNWRILAAVEAGIDAEMGIDARSMAKQIGPLLAATEKLIWMLRYVSALKSGGIRDMLEAGVAFMSTARATQGLSGALARVEAAQLEKSDARSLLTDPAYRQTTESILLDILLVRAITESVTPPFLDELHRGAATIFGIDDGIDEIFDAASQLYAVEATAPRTVMLAYGIAISDEEADGNPARRFFRDMLTVSHVAYSIGRPALLDRTVAKIVRGWTYVWAHQRFRLKSPAKNAPAVEETLAKAETGDLAGVAELLLVLAEMVDHPFGESWLEMLKTLKTGQLHVPSGGPA